jgi:anthranilate synthase/aminodeoxychorismate synthase-like glutamine amidotransferase
VIDNFDSFTHNLADYILQAGVDCKIVRNNIDPDELKKIKFDGIILSPGPGCPSDSGNLMKIIEEFYSKVPILGICLGHQALAVFFGADIKKALLPKHGKLSKINCEKDLLFNGIPQTFNVVRYHSLIIDRIPEELQVLAKSEEGEVMAFKHRKYAIYGLQYHPEAILTEFGKEVLKNWLFLNKIVDVY